MNDIKLLQMFHHDILHHLRLAADAYRRILLFITCGVLRILCPLGLRDLLRIGIDIFMLRRLLDVINRFNNAC